MLELLFTLSLIMAPQQNTIALPGNPTFFKNQNSEKLIIFIHGLTGDPVNTWSSDDNPSFFWPEQLAKDPDFQNADVLSFGYTSNRGVTLNIPQISQHLETTLNELNLFKQYKSISFVAHSLGGLVARYFILDHFREIKIDTLVLLSTPNFGHRMAKLVSYFSSNAHLEQLDPEPGKFIDGLNDRWLKEFREKSDREPFRLAAGYELFPLYRMLVKVGIIVEKYAAINFASHTQAFEDDHEQIAKPKSVNDPKYIWVRQQLLELPRDPRNREYTEAEEKGFEEIIDGLQKELKGTNLQKALNLISSGKLDEALQLLSENEEKEDKQIKKFARTRFAKAQVYELTLEYDKAFEYYQKAVQLAPDNSLYLNQAGKTANTLGKHNQAITYYEQALKSDLATFGPDHRKVATRWANLGLAYRGKGMHQKALEYNQRALDSYLKIFGPNHPRVANLWNNLGVALEYLHKYDKAIEYYEKALDIDLKTFGPEHPNVAIRWNNLGEAWRKKDDNNKAIFYLDLALASDLKTFGPEHPNVAIRWNNLGSTWYAKGNYDEAIKYFQRALDSGLKTFGSEHPYMVERLNNLATTWYAKDDFDKAIEYYEKAKKISQKLGLDDYAAIMEKNLEAVRRKKEGR